MDKVLVVIIIVSSAYPINISLNHTTTMSASPAGNASPSGSGTAPVNKHILTPTERQRLQVRIRGLVERCSLLILISGIYAQLERLLANPDKEVVVASGPVQKTLRPPREEMKNVQGSSAGVRCFGVYPDPRSSYPPRYTGRVRGIPRVQAESEKRVRAA